MTALELWAGPNDLSTASGRVTAAWAEVLNADPQMRSVVMVLELVLGNGMRMRASVEPVGSLAADGSGRDASPVLSEEPVLEEGYDPGVGAAPTRALGFTVPSWWLEPFAQVREGRPIAAFGEVSLMVDGLPWADRMVVMRGPVQGGVSYGAYRTRFTDRDGIASLRDSGVIELEVSDPRETADVAFPPWVVDEERWPLAPAFGAAYPIVYGGGDVKATKVSDNNKGTLLAAVGHGWTVEDVFRDGVAIGGFTAIETVDGLGVAVTVVRSLTGAPIADTERVIVRITKTDRPEPNLIRVIRDLLFDYAPDAQVLVNEELFATAEARLPFLPVQVQANTRTTLFRFIEDGILDQFPMVSMVWGQGRYGPVVTDWRDEPRMVLTLGDGLLLDRLDNPVQDQGEQLNSFLLRYDYDAVLDDFAGLVETRPDNDAICSVSAQDAGERPAPDIESVFIASALTAGAVQDWRVQHQALPTTLERYAAAPALMVLLRRGDSVELNDPDHPWVGARASVEELAYQRGRLELTLRVWSGPLRGGRLPA